MQWRTVKPWSVVAVLFTLCAVLGFLENRWLSQLSDAEDARIHRDLQSHLDILRSQFDAIIRSACDAVTPSLADVQQLGVKGALEKRVTLASPSQLHLFKRVALVFYRDGRLSVLSVAPGQKQPVEIDANGSWTDGPARFERGSQETPFSTPPVLPSDTLRVPLWNQVPGDREEPPLDGLKELVLSLDLDYLRAHTIPELMEHNLDYEPGLKYDVEIVDARDSRNIVFRTNSGHDVSSRAPDAAVSLLSMPDLRRERPWPGAPPAALRTRSRFPLNSGSAERLGPGPLPGPGGPNGGPPGPPPSRWRLLVRYSPGSLDRTITRVRWQNASISAILLLLILATGAVLARYSRTAQRLAELQLNFVAGVSHELRTPLATIRTAAYNLRTRVASRPEQVERYGQVILAESEKLTSLVEQVLSFASARSGNLVRHRQQIEVEQLIERSLATCSQQQEAEVVVEKKIEGGLPPISVDPVAVQHALVNLLTNAVKYGTNQVKWIGVSANACRDQNRDAVEIRIADRGPGIPKSEQEQIFEPFFRGERPIRDQVNGTGLGLSLVRYVAEAHGGSISVLSELLHGSEFILRLPVEECDARSRS